MLENLYIEVGGLLILLIVVVFGLGEMIVVVLLIRVCDELGRFSRLLRFCFWGKDCCIFVVMVSLKVLYVWMKFLRLGFCMSLFYFVCLWFFGFNFLMMRIFFFEIVGSYKWNEWYKLSMRVLWCLVYECWVVFENLKMFFLGFRLFS